jgi:ABC-type Mn2+/Zn2+ transport system ATPase subunit
MSAPQTGTGTEIVRFEGVTLGYGRRIVLEDLDFAIAAGDFLGIIGPNGSGKTTILRAALGRLRPRRGRVRISPGLRFGYVIQRQALDPLFPLSVRQVVEMGRYPCLGVMRNLGAADRAAVRDCLDMAGIAELADVPFRDLSGGQKQRALIARALATDPNVMLLDEPTNDLDVSGEKRVMELIHDIHHRRAITVVIVSHLLHVVLNHVDRLLFLGYDSRRIYSIDEIIERDLLSRIYGSRISVRTIEGKRVIVTE